MGKIPVGWMPYSPIGNQVPGTRFIAFKVPLRETFVDKLKPEDRFTVPILLERVPDLGLIIDLTQTLKYYNKNEVLDRGVDYVKIPTPGQLVPTQQYVERFFEVVDYYLDTHKNDDSLIGVHCTHGVNRTGYMLCRYLIQRLGYSFEEAVEAVGTARGHMIERSPYLSSLRGHTDTVQKRTTRGDLEEDCRLTRIKCQIKLRDLKYFKRRSGEQIEHGASDSYSREDRERDSDDFELVRRSRKNRWRNRQRTYGSLEPPPEKKSKFDKDKHIPPQGSVHCTPLSTTLHCTTESNTQNSAPSSHTPTISRTIVIPSDSSNSVATSENLSDPSHDGILSSSTVSLATESPQDSPLNGVKSSTAEHLSGENVSPTKP